MSKKNFIRKSFRDVFKTFLIENANFQGWLEIPVIKNNGEVPNKLISFSKAVASKDYNQWVHFFEDDSNFERIWNNPKKYLPILKKFNGVIAPDFSLYRDLPLIQQLWNIYRSRAIASWLQENDIKVIPNVRFGDARTFKYACEGIPKESIIAVGSHGCVKVKDEKEIFIQGLDVIVEELKPKCIVVFGTTPAEIFEKYQKQNIEIVSFSSDIFKIFEEQKWDKVS